MQWKKINPTPYSYSLWRILDFSHSLCKQFINTMTLIIPLSGGSSYLCCFLRCLTHHTQTIVIIKSSLLQNLATELYTHITWSTTIISRHSSSLLDFAVNECNVFHTTDTIYNLLEHFPSNPSATYRCSLLIPLNFDLLGRHQEMFLFTSWNYQIKTKCVIISYELIETLHILCER